MEIQPTFFSPPVTANVAVDHLLIGVQQELDNSRARAFISGFVIVAF